MRMHPGQVELDLGTVVRALTALGIAGEVRPLVSAGTVVAPYRVGETLVARFPLVPRPGADERTRLADEGRYARVLADALPIEVAQLVAVGEPVEGYDGVWSVWTWVDGESADRAEVELETLAYDLADVLGRIHGLTSDGTWSGTGRGGRPLADTDWVRTSIESSRHLLDPVALARVWDRALAAAPYDLPAATIHGDPMPGNLIVREGRLAGLVDVSRPVRGDPAADLQPAWEIFDEPVRSVFRRRLAPDEAAWERGRGWAFEMAIGALPYYEHTNPPFHRLALTTLQRLLAEG